MDLTEQELMELISKRYPKDPEEFHCAQLRQRLQELRRIYRENLLKNKAEVETPADQFHPMKIDC